MTENDPVADAELVLRRIPDNPDFYRSELPLPVTRLAFKPTPRDGDGLSVFRARFCAPSDLASRATKPCHIAQLLVQSIRQLNMDVVPAPDPAQGPGHALIPELRNPPAGASDDEKKRLKELGFRLAQLASQGVLWSP